MPVPTSRDPELARRDLERWLAARLPGSPVVHVTNFSMPPTSGFSNETVLFDAEIDGARMEVVARVAPATYRIFPDYDLGVQRRVMEALARTAIPVPEILWGGDADDSPFGQEFFVMRRVAGEAAPDLPPYTRHGWLLDATPAQQRQAYIEGLQQVVAVADVEWRGLGLDFLSDERHGAPGVEQELGYWTETLAWVAGDRAFPLLTDTLDRCRADAPDTHELRLSWGDSRPGNILYRDFHPVAVLDWEMACLAPREADLAWWLTYQVTSSVGWKTADLPGFPARAEAIGIYEELAGITVRDLEWWELFTAFRLGVILVRLGDMMGVPRVETPAFRTIEHLRSRT